MTRLCVLTEIIAPYRIPVFNALAREPEIDLHVIFLAETDRGLRQWQVYRDEIRFSFEVLPSWRWRIGGAGRLLNFGVAGALSRKNPGVVVCGGYNHLAFWQAARWAEKRRVPLVLWTESNAHDHRANHALVEAAKKNYLRRCAGFLVPGKASREYLQALGAGDREIFVAPDAVDNDLFWRSAEAARRAQCAGENQDSGLPSRYFLYTGRLVEEKGVLDLVGAYGMLDPELRQKVGLVLVGDGSAREAAVHSARAVSPGDICFAGFQQREKLARYYALADAFVFPTYSDPWGLVVNEAMACGLPVIASRVAGCTTDLVEDGWNGRVFEPGDRAALARHMAAVAADDALRARMGANSRLRIANYSPEACAAGFAAAARALGVAR